MTETSTLVTTTTRSSQRPQPAPEGPRRSTRRRWPKGRDESGLTTLEWLLIVAAVAGLAALAVVLVQNVVSETSEQIAGSSARETAAKIAADQIMRDADRDADAQPAAARAYDDWAEHYRRRCQRLAITYGDAGIDVYESFTYEATTAANKVTDVNKVTAAEIETGLPDAPITLNANGGYDSGLVELSSTGTIIKAVAHCVIA